MNSIVCPYKDLIPNWMLGLQCICFSILYTVWALPDTIAMRYVCLGIGALIGLYEIYCYRAIFLNKKSISIWLLFMLFGWSSVHLLFIGENFLSQLNEYAGIWKNAALATIFAIGFGIALSNYEIAYSKKSFLVLVFIGLTSPIAVYFAKYIITHYMAPQGWSVSRHLLLYTQDYNNPYYFAKAKYVCFCLPAFSIALALLKNQFLIIQSRVLSNVIYLITVTLVLVIFYNESIKNGVIYCGIIGIILIVSWSLHRAIKISNYELLMIGISLVTILGISYLSVKHNNSWDTFFSDAKVALDGEQYPYWKYHGAKGYPKNDMGSIVSVTNYERISWAKAALKLIAENPLGYGLLDYSFGRLAKKPWPDSNLEQSHSGWLDLMMGIGIPGFLLILGSAALSLYRIWVSVSCSSDSFSRLAASWSTLSLALAWISTEASQTILFEELLFWIAFAAGVSHQHVLTDLSQERPNL